MVDGVLIGAVVVFAVAGWFRGFISGLMSFVGFLGGGLAAAFLLPLLVDDLIGSDIGRILAVGIGVLAFALIGQLLASVFGDRLRDSIPWHPARRVDNVAGAALNVLALAIVTWIVASAIAYLPVTVVSQQVSESRVLVALDSLVPAPARNAFGSLRDLVATTSVPRIFSGLAQVTGPDVDPPDGSAITAAVEAARPSVLRIVSDVDECDAQVSGSGFAVGRDRVITNAHVVAGVARPIVRRRGGAAGLAATVVYFDPRLDVAVLAVPGLDARPLALAPERATSGDPAVIAGFPLAGPFRLEPARVRTEVLARGDDIYGSSGVEREVYVLRGRVLPGNSGGPLLRPDGLVLGLVFGADEQAESTGYALTAGELSDAIAAGLSSDTAVDTGSCRIRD